MKKILIFLALLAFYSNAHAVYTEVVVQDSTLQTDGMMYLEITMTVLWDYDSSGTNILYLKSADGVTYVPFNLNNCDFGFTANYSVQNWNSIIFCNSSWASPFLYEAGFFTWDPYTEWIVTGNIFTDFTEPPVEEQWSGSFVDTIGNGVLTWAINTGAGPVGNIIYVIVGIIVFIGVGGLVVYAFKRFILKK